MTNISLVTVCHKSQETIADYVRTFLATNPAQPTGPQFDFVFVENSGQVNEIRRAVGDLSTSGRHVQVIECQNTGFGSACNVGAKHAHGDVIAFVNPDVRFLSDLKPLAIFADGPKWGTIAQLTSNGHIYSLDLLPERRGFFTDLLRLYRVANLHPGWFRTNLYVVGSFLVVNRTLFQATGGFDPRFFLYYEEAELARRLYSKGGDPILLRDMAIFHEGFGSHETREHAMRHEAQGFLTYCRLTSQPQLIDRRLSYLRLLGVFSQGIRRMHFILQSALEDHPPKVPEPSRHQ